MLLSPGRLSRSIPGLACAALVATLLGCSTPSPAPVEIRGDRAPIRSTVYIVQTGDTLWSIAWRSGFDYRQLAAWNGLRSPYTIYPGQRLRLTSPHRTASRPPPKRLASESPAPRTYPRPPPSHAPSKQAPQPSSKPQVPASSPAATVSSGASGSLHWRWPIDGGVVVQGFSAGDATRKGMKIRGDLGQPIVAAEAGRVVYSGSGLIGYGRLIIIKHNKDYLSAYGYNRKILVQENDQVARGQHIADMGRNGGGPPMLHFEIRRRGKPVDPAKVLPSR